jgi:hypothetical protein
MAVTAIRDVISTGAQRPLYLLFFELAGFEPTRKIQGSLHCGMR